MKIFRVDKRERYSTWIRGKASIAWLKTWGLTGYDLVESYKEINITNKWTLRS